MNLKVPALINSIFKEEKEEYVCLDAGSEYIKIIYVAGRDIKKFIVCRREKNLAKTFSEWLHKEGLGSKKVRVSLKGNNTLIRYTPFPKVDKKNIKEVFGYEISKYIPFKAEDIYFDVAVLDENHSAKEFLLLVAVAKKSFVDSLISEFQQEKINIDAITLNNIALINLYLNSRDTESNIATLDIGASSTLLNLFKKGVPSLSREIKISAAEFSARLMKLKNINEEEAEHIIINLDEARETTEVQEIIEIIEEIGLELAEEVKNSLDYFEVNSGDRIQKILITGGLSKIKGLNKIIENSLGIGVELWNPYVYASHYNINGQIENYKEFLAVALGMSL